MLKSIMQSVWNRGKNRCDVGEYFQDLQTRAMKRKLRQENVPEKTAEMSS